MGRAYVGKPSAWIGEKNSYAQYWKDTSCCFKRELPALGFRRLAEEEEAKGGLYSYVWSFWGMRMERWEKIRMRRKKRQWGPQHCNLTWVALQEGYPEVPEVMENIMGRQAIVLVDSGASHCFMSGFGKRIEIQPEATRGYSWRWEMSN